MPPTEALYLRIDPGLKDRLASAARVAGRSLNGEVVERLRRSLGEREVGSGDARDHAGSAFVKQAPAASRSPSASSSAPSRPSPADLAEKVSGVTTGAALKAGRNVTGAPPGMCVHHLPLEGVFCKKCAAGE